MNILLRGTNWIGDSVMTIPAMREVRNFFPEARITLYTRSWAKGIFENADFIDEILPFERTDSLLDQIKALRPRKFDLGITLANSFNSALSLKLSSIPKRFGYNTEARGFVLSNSPPVPDWKNSRHEVYYYLNLIGEVEKEFGGNLAIDNCDVVPKLSVSDERKASARKLLESTGIDLSRPIVVLCPGSTNSRAKRWGIEKYARLNDGLQEATANVILVGSEDEVFIAEKVIDAARLKPFSLTGKTDLSALTAILCVADVCISNDTGTAHIAAAVGTKTMVIFGPTNPQTTQPMGAGIFRNPVDCSPCMLRDCPIDHPCMTGISVEEVLEKVLAL